LRDAALLGAEASFDGAVAMARCVAREVSRDQVDGSDGGVGTTFATASARKEVPMENA
jgi:hypothetical protein